MKHVVAILTLPRTSVSRYIVGRHTHSCSGSWPEARWTLLLDVYPVRVEAPYCEQRLLRYYALSRGIFCDNILNRLINSDMVATPVVDQRNTTFHSGGEHHCTTLKLTPRKGVTEQWMEQMYDLLSNQKLKLAHRQ